MIMDDGDTDFTMEDFDPFIAEERERRARRITGSGATAERNARLFGPPAALSLGGFRPESPSEAELDVVQQVLQAEDDEARTLFRWAVSQLPKYGEANALAIARLLSLPPSPAGLALCRAGFLLILANSVAVRRVASAGYVAERLYHNIPVNDMHKFFACVPVNEARRQYVIMADGTGQTSDTKAARSVLFVNRVRNMVQRGGVEGFVAQYTAPGQQQQQH